MTTHVQGVTAPTYLDNICYTRLNAPDFATPRTLKQKLAAAFRQMGGAK